VRAPAFFGAGHLPAVLFVVEAEQVQEAVQHQDFDLALDAVTELPRLPARAPEGDGKIAEMFGGGGGWKGKHVGGIIQTAELVIQAAQLDVAGDEATERLSLGDLPLKAERETFDGAAAEVGWRAAKNDGTTFG